MAWPADDPGLYAWWDCSNTGSITHSSGNVTQIADLEGSLPLIGTGSPRTGDETQNSLNVVRVSDGGSTRYLTASAGSNVIPVVGGFTMYGVFKYGLAFNDYRGLVSMRQSASSLDEQTPNVMPFHGRYYGEVSGWMNANETTPIQGSGVEAWRVYRLRYSGTTAVLNYNGANPGTATWGTLGTNMRYLRIGGRLQADSAGVPTFANPSILVMAELCHTTSVDKDYEYLGYLGTKWNISVTNPPPAGGGRSPTRRRKALTMRGYR